MDRVGVGRRLIAAMIDSFAQSVLAFTMIFILAIASGAFRNIHLSEEQVFSGGPLALKVAVILLVPLFSMLVYSSLEIFLAATPGKLVMGIYIGSEEGGRAALENLVLRWVTKNICLILSITALAAAVAFPGLAESLYGIGKCLGAIIGLGMLMILGDERQALHDKIALTAIYKE